MKKTDVLFAIIGALDAEIKEYLKHLKKLKKNTYGKSIFYEGQFCGKNVVIAKSGVGKVFAAMTTQKLINNYNLKSVILTGVGGGLNKKLKIGDIVVGKDCVQHDLDVIELNFPRGTIPYTNYRFFKTDPKLRSLALATPTKHIIYEGRVLTGDQFLTKKQIKKYNYLIDELKGDIIEMEGAAVGQVCFLNNIPFLIIRTVSDKADSKASINFNKFLPEVVNNSFHVVSHILKNY